MGDNDTRSHVNSEGHQSIIAPTIGTNRDTISSDAGQSRAFTTQTGGGISSLDGGTTGGGAGSTFSSPNDSQHSLATTLTTIQSINNHIPPVPSVNNTNNNSNSNNNNNNLVLLNATNQNPQQNVISTCTTPLSALPPHLTPSAGHPSTYTTATANNILTDDASILTLASSSKRARRRSIDTDASVRALAPNSLWGGSRESLPLSTIEQQPQPSSSVPGLSGGNNSIRSAPNPERNSIYSVSTSMVGAPALVSDRNSFYAGSMRPSIKERERDPLISSTSYRATTVGEMRERDRELKERDMSDGRSVNAFSISVNNDDDRPVDTRSLGGSRSIASTSLYTSGHKKDNDNIEGERESLRNYYESSVRSSGMNRIGDGIGGAESDRRGVTHSRTQSYSGTINSTITGQGGMIDGDD